MSQLSPEMQDAIKAACRGKTHIKLTVGTLMDGEKTIRAFDATGEIPDGNHLYEIGSNTKTIVASLLAKYVHEGKMSLDDSVSKYIDGLDKNTYYPTLKRLATHTAGYDWSMPVSLGLGLKLMFNTTFRSSANKGVLPFNVDEAKLKQLMQKNRKQDRDYPYQYANFGFAVLGHAIGAVSGRGYWDTMDDYLTTELGMTNSSTGRRAGKKLHGFDKKNRDIGNWDWGDDFMAPAGDVFSTADDMLTYAKNNMHDGLPYLALCHKKHAEMSKQFADRFVAGLGWPLDKNNNNILVGSGGTGAFHTLLVVDRQKKIAYTALSNYHIDLVKFLAVVLDEVKKS